jgi:hypothetical protein
MSYSTLGNSCNSSTNTLTSNAKYIAPLSSVYYDPWTDMLLYPGYTGFTYPFQHPFGPEVLKAWNLEQEKNYIGSSTGTFDSGAAALPTRPSRSHEGVIPSVLSLPEELLLPPEPYAGGRRSSSGSENRKDGKLSAPEDDCAGCARRSWWTEGAAHAGSTSCPSECAPVSWWNTDKETPTLEDCPACAPESWWESPLT